MSNIAGFGNLGNSQGGGGGGDQGDVDCTQKVKECWSNVPLYSRFVFWTCMFLLLVSLFIGGIAELFVNYPPFTIQGFQIWRLFTAPFVSMRPLSLLFSLCSFISRGMQNERSRGTNRFFIYFWWMSVISQSILVGLFYLIFLTFKREAGVSMALWSLVLADMTIDSIEQPDIARTCCCIPFPIKSKYFPYIFMAICLFVPPLLLAFVSGYLTGLLYAYGYLGFTEPSDRLVNKVHNLIFRHFETHPAFVSQNDALGSDGSGAGGLPMFVRRAQQEQNNMPPPGEPKRDSGSSSTPPSSFEAFKGRGVSLGSNIESAAGNNISSYTTQQNVREEPKGPNPNVQESKLINNAPADTIENNEENNETINSNDSKEEDQDL